MGGQFDMKTVNILGEECYLQLGHYSNKRKSIRLISKEDGMSVGVLTVNFPGMGLENADEVAVKLWSENKVFEQLLTDYDIFEDTGKRYDTNLVSVHVWRIVDYSYFN